MKARILLIMLFILTGCTLFQSNTSPKRTVEHFFSKYQTLDKEIDTQLDDVISKEDLTETQKKDYKEIMKKQYNDLTYTIKDEIIDGNNAIVTVEIEVYDLAGSQKDIEENLNENREDFLKDNEFSNELYMNYRIKKLKEERKRIKYTLDLRLTKNDKDKWFIDDLSEAEKKKIHGVY